MNAHPIDAYSAAVNGSDGFVGWAHYQDTGLGLHADADDETVEVWSVNGETDTAIDASGTPEQYLAALDEVLAA